MIGIGSVGGGGYIIAYKPMIIIARALQESM